MTEPAEPHLRAVPPPPDDPQRPDTRLPSHDAAAERWVLGACLQHPPAIHQAAIYVTDADFYFPFHADVWRALLACMGRGQPTDHVTVSRELAARGVRHDLTQLDALIAAAPTITNADYFADIVRGHYEARQADQVGVRITQAANNPATGRVELRAFVREQLEALTEQLDDPQPGPGARTIDQFLAGAEDEHYDWLIPGLLERQDRVILTAEEGAGKSTLLRQVGVQAATGIHPFTYELATPVRVLLLDLENHERQVRRELRPLHARAGDMLDPQQLRVECRTQGLDLSNEQDRVWLSQLVTDARPDLIVTGPIYKMADGDPNDEKFAKPVALFLDHIRAEHDCALWLEAHVGNESQGQKRRPERPFGWSGWRRWPEFGVYLSKDGDLNHWRGQRDASREWPTMLMRGGEWPWSPARSDSDLIWQRIRECVLDAGEMLTNREVARRLNISASTIDRTTRSYSQHYAALKARFHTDDEE